MISIVTASETENSPNQEFELSSKAVQKCGVKSNSQTMERFEIKKNNPRNSLEKDGKEGETPVFGS